MLATKHWLRCFGFRSGLVVVIAWGCLLTTGCETEPCRMEGPEPTGELAAVLALLDVQEPNKVCGMMHMSDRKVLLIGHPEGHSEEIGDRYGEALVEAGFEEKSGAHPSWTRGRTFINDDIKVKLKVSGHEPTDLMIEDLSHEVRAQIAQEEKRQAKIDDRAKRFDDTRKALSSWLPAANSAIEKALEKGGASQCPEGQEWPAKMRIFDPVALQAAAEGKKEIDSVTGIGKPWTCGPWGRLGHASDGLGADCQLEALSGDVPVAMLFWEESGLEFPRLTASARPDSPGTFLPGFFRGHLVIYSPTEEQVLCHAPIKAESSQSVETTITVDQDGNVIPDQLLDEDFDLSVDFVVNLQVEVESELRTMIGRDK